MGLSDGAEDTSGATAARTDQDLQREHAAEEAAWLSQHALELAAIRPEQVLKRLFRALNRKVDEDTAPLPLIPRRTRSIIKYLLYCP